MMFQILRFQSVLKFCDSKEDMATKDDIKKISDLLDKLRIKNSFIIRMQTQHFELEYCICLIYPL